MAKWRRGGVQAADVLIQDGEVRLRVLLLLCEPALGIEGASRGVPVVLHGALGPPARKESSDRGPPVPVDLVRLDQRQVVFLPAQALLCCLSRAAKSDYSQAYIIGQMKIQRTCIRRS
jgi:hypothetical protein